MRSRMKALVKEKAGPGAMLKFVAVPELGPHDVLVKVAATSICGTDLHIYKWDKWAAERIKPPVVFGHEMAGYVKKVGTAVERWREGDYVSLECHQNCGHCYQCKTGRGHICSDCKILGVDFDGCFAEYVRVPEGNLWKLNPGLPAEVACLHDPVGNAVMAMTAVDIAGKTVMVTGCGAIGLFAIGVARVLGAAKIYAVEINDYRLHLAELMGAGRIINPLRENPVETVLEDTGGSGVDAVAEMSGDKECFQYALKAVKNGGEIVLLGIPSEDVCLDLANEIIFKGVTLAGISGREIFATWYKTSALLSSNLDVSHVITHKMKLEQFEEAFKLVQEGMCGKIILYPGEETR